MNLLENIKLALSSLRAGKMRALLTMLGIIIGIAAVITIATVGNSLSSNITSMMNDMGANQVFGYLSTKERNVNIGMTESDLIPQEWIDQFAERYTDEIKAVIMTESAGNAQAKEGRRYANVSLTGVTQDSMDSIGNDMIKGRDINERDIKSAANVAVVADRFVEKMFPYNDSPLGQEISVTSPTYGVLTFTIVGIYSFELPAMVASFVPLDDMPSDMIIPLTTAKRITGAPDGFSMFYAMLADGMDSSVLQNHMTTFFDQKYESNPNFTVFTQNMESQITMLTDMLDTVSVAISIIAAISLLVGGIGVMNIMLVSVTERTREVGTRMALGARASEIRAQFITESMIICLIGGIIGILMGLGLGSVATTVMGFPAEPSIPVIILAVVVSMAIGIFFGFYPANKAAKLDPIEALRYE
jgi:putative ABC transport system permease protein